METSPDALPVTESETAVASGPPRRRRGGGILLALIVLVALAVAAWFGWQWWQRQQAGSAAGRAQLAAQKSQLAHMQEQIDGFGNAVDALGTQRGALRDRLNDSEASNRRLQEQVSGLNQRVEQLEAAVAGLSRRQFSGHDGMLLDDAEMLLQLAAQRHDVLHDAAGADRALALAAQALAGVDDAAYTVVRQRVADERAALAAIRPASRQANLDSVAKLRAVWPTLPLKPLDQPAPVERGAWQRVWHAVSGLVRIRRDDAGDLDDARLARQLAVLDLATAQAALLDNDNATAHAALTRVAGSLARDLDATDAAVVHAADGLDRLLTATSTTGAAPVRLGAALTELRNVRGVQAIAPAAASTVAPAGAGSTP